MHPSVADPLLAFIDQLSLDDKLYWRLARADALGEVEVSWERHVQPSPWRWRAIATPIADWTPVEAQALRAALAAAGVDTAYLDRHIGASVLTQAVYADMVLEAVRNLFGADVVARSIDDTKAFLEALSVTARALTQQAAAPQAGIGETIVTRPTARATPRLQLVGAAAAATGTRG